MPFRLSDPTDFNVPATASAVALATPPSTENPGSGIDPTKVPSQVPIHATLLTSDAGFALDLQALSDSAVKIGTIVNTVKVKHADLLRP